MFALKFRLTGALLTGDLGTMHCIGAFVITPENEALGGSATCTYVDGGSDSYDLSGSVEGIRSGNAWTGSWHATTVSGFEMEFSGAGEIDGSQLTGTFTFVDDDYSVTVELK